MSRAIREAEAAITQAMIDGSLPNHRLLIALRHLDEGRFRMPLTTLRQALPRYGELQVSEGVCMVLNDLHVRQRIPVADLQILAIGFYRLIWRLVVRLDRTLSLTDLRQLTGTQATRACYGLTFGSRLWPLPFPGEWCARMHARLRRFMRAEGLDQTWCERRPVPLAIPLVTVSDPQLNSSANAIRNTFLGEVFTQALFAEPGSTAANQLVIDALFAADRHPEHITFLRHLERPQARFRLRQLAQATMALHHQTIVGAPLASGMVARESAISCLLSPFASLLGWLRTKSQPLRIPLVRNTPAGDALIVTPPAAAIIAEHATTCAPSGGVFTNAQVDGHELA